MLQRLALLVLLCLLPGAAEARRSEVAERAYQSARQSYFALKRDAARRKLRHNWLKVARRFEDVSQRYPRSQRAPDALYTAGDLMHELSRISFVSEDLQAAISAYSRLMDAHARHRLADDAALALARIYVERLDQPENARRVIHQSLAAAPRGDRNRQLKALLASLPAPAKAAPARRSAPESAPEPPAVAAGRGARSEPESLAGKAERSASAVVEVMGRIAREASPRPAPVSAPDPFKPVLGEALPRRPEPAPVEAPVVAIKLGQGDARRLEAVPEATDSAEEAPGPGPEPMAVEARVKPAPTVSPEVAQARLKAAVKLQGRTELSLAEQLGLKVRRVVIDAGHGGHDTGAIGRGGTREKDVTLAIARKLADQLRERGLEVLLTRDDDSYIRLEERAQIANDAHGDLFISIHCNSAPRARLRGIETYTLNIAADRYSIRLAARENASSERRINDLQFILADLATKANTEESRRLASQVQKSLVTQLRQRYDGVKDLGTKEALFYVLLGARMPAILVETAFLSNGEEEKRLASEEYQHEVARAVARGVEEFLGGRHELAKVD